MAKALVIVESPAKAKTINKYLGRDFKVIASMGHVRDLPKSKLGVDVDAGFEPEYVVIPDRAKVIKELKDAAKTVDEIYVATDPDREGEAIGWHLAEELGANKKKVRRLMFNEITKKAILEAIKHPGEIDMQMVDAQQARRVLDRLVGYKISPILWDKVRRGLSAGRVQSVALKLICDREREIEAFVAGRVLAHHGAARAARAAGVRRAARAQGRGGRQGQERGGSRGGSRRPRARDVRRLVGRDEGAEEARGSAVHHEQAAAGVALPGQEDDDGRAAAVRRHRAAGRRSARSVSSPTCAPTRCASPIRRSTKCATHIGTQYGDAYVPEQANRYKVKSNGAGRARGDSADVDGVPPGGGAGVPRRRISSTSTG